MLELILIREKEGSSQLLPHPNQLQFLWGRVSRGYKRRGLFGKPWRAATAGISKLPFISKLQGKSSSCLCWRIFSFILKHGIASFCMQRHDFGEKKHGLRLCLMLKCAHAEKKLASVVIVIIIVSIHLHQWLWPRKQSCLRKMLMGGDGSLEKTGFASNLNADGKRALRKQMRICSERRWHVKEWLNNRQCEYLDTCWWETEQTEVNKGPVSYMLQVWLSCTPCRENCKN